MDIQKIPDYIKNILTVLNSAGYEAYLVGGAVRDLLLGICPDDYDITTNAVPKQILAICQTQGWKTVDNLGHNFGCVIIVINGVTVEVTTFRGERYDKQDAHRPSATWFCQSLREDLSRRDFTVNAMALDINGNLYDFFNGQQDLQQKILRTVGKAEQRFQEDALRMLRACRFIGQLGFTYVQDDDNTLPPYGQPLTPYYLPVNYKFPSERCSGLSLERVRKELEKLLLSSYAGKGLMLMQATGILGSSCRVQENGREKSIPILPEAAHLVGLKQNPRFHLYNTWEHTLLAVDSSPRNLAVRWTLLLHDLGKGLPGVRRFKKDGQPTDPGHEAKSAAMAQEILTRLRYSKDFIHLVVWLTAQHMRFAPMLVTGERTLLRWVRTEAQNAGFRNQKELAEAFELLVDVFLADMGATNARENKKLMAEGQLIGRQVIELVKTKMPVCTKDLNISGHELLTLIPQTKIKDMLAYLLERVQSGNLPNEKYSLLAAVKKNLSRQQDKGAVNENR